MCIQNEADIDCIKGVTFTVAPFDRARAALEDSERGFMNYRQIVDVAALVSARSGEIIHDRYPTDIEITRYVDCSQRLFGYWSSQLLRGEERLRATSSNRRSELMRQMQPVLDEIWVSEMLTRTWGAVLACAARKILARDYETRARHILIGHLGVRRQALELMTRNTAYVAGGLARFSDLSLRVERWTDLLLSHLVEAHGVDDFAFDPRRSREFQCRVLLQSAEAPLVSNWTILLSALRTAFSRIHAPVGAESSAQREVVTSVLACFPAAVVPATQVTRLAVQPGVCVHAPAEKLQSPYESTGRQWNQSFPAATDCLMPLLSARLRNLSWLEHADLN